jgi:hypothetical protein
MHLNANGILMNTYKHDGYYFMSFYDTNNIEKGAFKGYKVTIQGEITDEFSLESNDQLWDLVKGQRKKKSVLFEDRLYKVTSHCSSELGCIVSFYNKKDNQTYQTTSYSPIVVNKLNNVYYITSSSIFSTSSITAIVDPKKLKIKKFNKIISPKQRDSLDLLDDVEIKSNFPKIRFNTSFISNGKLYHIYNSNGKSCIGEIKNSELSCVQELNIFPKLMQIEEGNNQFLSFFSKDDFKITENVDSGIIEIINGKIIIHYLEN